MKNKGGTVAGYPKSESFMVTINADGSVWIKSTKDPIGQVFVVNEASAPNILSCFGYYLGVLPLDCIDLKEF